MRFAALFLITPLLAACAYDNTPIQGGPFPDGPYGNGSYPPGSVTYPPAPPATPPYYSDVYGQDPYAAPTNSPAYPTNPYVQAPSTPGTTITDGKGLYRAIGTEPFWDLTIGSALTFTDRGRNLTVVQPTPQPRIGTTSRIWQTQRLTVTVTHTQCSDGMSDKRYPDTVRVIVDGQPYKGCGGVPANGYVSY